MFVLYDFLLLFVKYQKTKTNININIGMNKKYAATVGIFVVTNVCNYNCDNCNRLSNFHFAGKYRWADHKEEYRQWSEKVHLDRWEITGGEPMTSPDWMDWVRGVHELWPDSEGWFCTNGSLMDKNSKQLDDYYQLAMSSKGLLTMVITYHNANRLGDVLKFIHSYLKDPIPTTRQLFNNEFVRIYKQLKSDDWPECNSFEDWDSLPPGIKLECENNFNFSVDILKRTTIETMPANGGLYFEDINGVKIRCSVDDEFHDSPIIPDFDSGTFTLHNSDPEKAFEGCHEKSCCSDGPWSVVQFIEGKIYKCGASRLINDFDQQFHLNISDEDRQLLQSYIPGTVTQTVDELDHWFKILPYSIPQCKFCTEDWTYNNKFEAGTKKIFFKKKPRVRE